MLFVLQKFFLEKFEFVLIASFTILLMCTTIDPLFKYLFFLPYLAPLFLLHLIIFIWVHLFLSVRVSSYLWESLLIYDRLWESFLIRDHMWESFRTTSCFLNLCENKQAYEQHDLRCVCHHQNMIMIFCWLHMFQFCVFYFEFFSFCVWLLFY